MSWGTVLPAIGAFVVLVGGLAFQISVWKRRGYRRRRSPAGFVADGFIAGGEPFDFDHITNPSPQNAQSSGETRRGRRRRRGRPYGGH